MTSSNRIKSIFAGITFSKTSLSFIFRNFRVTILLGWVFFGPEAFNGRSGTNEPAAHEALDFFDFFAEPAIVLMRVKVGFSKLRANGEPAVPDIIGVAKKLNFFTAQTKSLDHIVNFLWLLQRAKFWLFCHNYIDINIRMNNVMARGFFRFSFVTHETVLLDSHKDPFFALRWVLLPKIVCFYPNNILTPLVAPCFHEFSGVFEMLATCP